MNLAYSLKKFGNKLFFRDFNRLLKKGKVFPPLMVVWDCTRRCNLKCKHCGATKERYEKELTTEEIKKVIDELAEIKVRFFAATGGEPLFRKDIFEVMEYASKKGIDTGIATNGFFINKEIAGKLKKINISSIQISLDGPEEIHNKIRGNSQSFQRAINAIRLLEEQKIPLVSVATTITPMNLNELDKLRELLLDLKVKMWRISVVMPIGRAEKSDLMLSPAQLKGLLEFVSKNNSKEMKILIAENLTFLREYEKKIRDTPLTCSVGFTACCIGVDGNVRGCPEMPDKEGFIEGNILKKSFKEIWKNEFKKYRNREVLKTDKRCAACKNKNDCLGGCWVMREGNTQCIHDLLKD